MAQTSIFAAFNDGTVTCRLRGPATGTVSGEESVSTLSVSTTANVFDAEAALFKRDVISYL